MNIYFSIIVHNYWFTLQGNLVTSDSFLDSHRANVIINCETASEYQNKI